VFGKQVARIIAVADNHYPGVMHSLQELENGFKLAISLSRTAKSTFHGVKDNNYTIVDPGLTTAKIGEDEVANQSPLGTQADVAENEQDHKSLGDNVGSSDHGDAVSEAILSPCLDKEKGVGDIGEPYVAEDEQDHKSLGANVGSSDHGDVGSEAILSPCLDQEEGVDDVGEP
jgi:hypothetical protein